MIIEAREDVVQLEGELDKNLWPTIQAAANLLLRHHVEGIIVNGSELTGCSAEGAKTFRDAMDYIERYRARIVVCALPDDVMGMHSGSPGSSVPPAGDRNSGRSAGVAEAVPARTETAPTGAQTPRKTFWSRCCAPITPKPQVPWPAAWHGPRLRPTEHRSRACT